jgi:hypothetical protein
MRYVMALHERQGAARKATGTIPVLECTSQRRRNRPGPGSDFHDIAGVVMAHDDPARIARQTPGRSRGNVWPVFEERLPGLVRVGQHCGIDMHHDLVPLAGRAGVELMMQRRFGH